MALIGLLLIFSQEKILSQDLLIDSLKISSINILEQNLHNLSRWEKVHAAEYLLWTNHPKNLYFIFQNQNKKFVKVSEYRIGIWRVLAETSQSSINRKRWIAKITGAFLDTLGMDRVHAAETLAKLKTSPLLEDPIITLEAMESDSNTLSFYTRWSVCYSSVDLLLSQRKWFLDFLNSNKGSTADKRLAAYIIGKLGTLPYEDWFMLSKIALKEPDQSKAKVPLLSASLSTAPRINDYSSTFHNIKQTLITLGTAPEKMQRIELAISMAKIGDLNDLPVLLNLLNDTTSLTKGDDYADVRSAVAYAILCIKKREAN